jgi:hypothetical protein
MNVVPSSQAATLAYIQQLLNDSHGHPWVVVVCPDRSPQLSLYRQFQGILAPAGSLIDGATVTRADGTKVSVVGGLEEDAVPADANIQVKFLGWGTDVVSGTAPILKWHKRCLPS